MRSGKKCTAYVMCVYVVTKTDVARTFKGNADEKW